MANSLAELVVNLTAETASFSRKMDSAASDLKKFGQTADSVMRGIKTIGATLGIAFSADAIIDFGKRSLEAMDRINKLSQSTGVQVDALSAMAYAGRLADVELDALAKALERLSKNAFDAAGGGGTAEKAFHALGISVKDANGQIAPVERLVMQIADRFSTMQDGTAKTALAMQLFGRTGAELIPLLNQGGTAIGKMADEARRAGFAFSKDAAQAAEDFKDNLERLDMQLQGLGNRIMGNLVRSLASLSDEMARAGQNDSLVTLADNISGAITRVIIVVDAAITGIRMLTLRLEDVAELSRAIQTTPGGNPGAALAQYYLGRQDRSAEWDQLNEQWQKRSTAVLFPTTAPRTASSGNTAPPPAPPASGKDLTAQLASAKAEIDSLLAQIAAENFNVADKVRADWQKSIDKIAENFRKFPQLARLPEVQAAGGEGILLFHARMQAETAARQAQLEQDIKLLQDATKAYEQVLRDMGPTDYPNIPNKPTATPVLSDTPYTPYEVELEKLKTSTEQMGQLANDVWMQTRTAAEQYAQELEKLNILHEEYIRTQGKAGISLETYNRAVDQLKQKLDRNTIAMRNFGQELMWIGENAVTNWRGWRDMVEQLTQALIRLAFQLLVVNKLQDAAAKSRSGGGGWGSVIPGLISLGSFGGLHDYAGPAYAGVSYMIGTKEFFTPKTDGYITPANQVKGGGVTNVYNIDARGAAPGVEVNVMRAIAAAKNQAVQESILAVEERRRRS